MPPRPTPPVPDPRRAIRPAAPRDLPRLAEIERAAAAVFEPYGLDRIFAERLTPADALEAALREGRLWVAVDARDAPVGFAVACTLGSAAHLDELDVHPDYMRRGLGTALVEAVERWAVARGAPALTLTTLRHVPWNAPFYEKLGFREIPAAALPPALRRQLDEEIARGLPAANRIAMRKPLATLEGGFERMELRK